MEPSELCALAIEKKSVTCPEGTKAPVIGVWPGKHQPAAMLLSMQFRYVTQYLPILIPYVKKEDRTQPGEKKDV